MSKMLEALREQRSAKEAEAALLLDGDPTPEALTPVANTGWRARAHSGKRVKNETHPEGSAKTPASRASDVYLQTGDPAPSGPRGILA